MVPWTTCLATTSSTKCGPRGQFVLFPSRGRRFQYSARTKLGSLRSATSPLRDGLACAGSGGTRAAAGGRHPSLPPGQQPRLARRRRAPRGGDAEPPGSGAPPWRPLGPRRRQPGCTASPPARPTRRTQPCTAKTSPLDPSMSAAAVAHPTAAARADAVVDRVSGCGIGRKSLPPAWYAETDFATALPNPCGPESP